MLGLIHTVRLQPQCYKRMGPVWGYSHQKTRDVMERRRNSKHRRSASARQ